MTSLVSPGEGRPIWVDIQLHTFANWINEQLPSRPVRKLPDDLSDGVLLIQLVEVLQGRRYFGKIYHDDPTEIQKLMNVQMALDALREDGVKTVNIGSQDIVEGNTKLILGLIWCLVQRYQIASKTKIPPKKLVMAWMQSVLPDLKLTNFRTNWNDGRALSALLEYCQPGLCPEWMGLDPRNALENCERALNLADHYLGIPPILSAEHLSSPHLDELSCITYLSYFITKGGPGYRATLQRSQLLLADAEIQDLDNSWSDGYLLSALVEAVGGRVENMNTMRFNCFEDFVDNVTMALNGALEIDVGSLVGAEDIADPQGEHLGTMALVAALCAIGPQPEFQVTQCFVNQQVNLDLAFSEGNEVRVEDLDLRVVGPSGKQLSPNTLRLRKSRTVGGAVISLVPVERGFHQVRIYCQGVELPSSPISLQVLTQDESRATSRSFSRQTEPQSPVKKSISVERSDSGASDVDISHKSFAQRRQHIIKQLEAQQQQQLLKQKPPPTRRSSSPVKLEASAHQEMALAKQKQMDTGLVSFSGLTEPCSVGSIVEVVINAHGDATAGTVYVDAVSPLGKVTNCHVTRKQNCYMATFTPNEVGLWKIGILYEGEHIRGSPFSCQVFDASLVNTYGLSVGLVGQELSFTVDTQKAGKGDLKVSVYHRGVEIPCTVTLKGTDYHVNFVPDGAGQYHIHVLFNRMNVKGSPFVLDIADASSVSVFGENLRMASVGKEATFNVHAVGSDTKDITVIITAPSGRKTKGKVENVDDVTFRILWTPVETGEHSMDVRMYDQSVYDSPFVCNVGAPRLVSVRQMPRRILSKDLHTDQSFEIDASTAGSGNLEIMINGGRVPCRVKEIGSRQYMAIFTPTQSITHTVEMRFNGEEVPGSPWKIPVEDRGERRQDMSRTMSYYSELSGPGLVRAPITKTASFDITGEGLELNDIQAKIYGPDGREFPIRIIPRGPGKFTAEYRIEEVGEHQLTVWIGGRKVDGSPLSVAGYASQNVRIEPLGGGAVGQPVQFVVDAVDAGKGQLEISVNQGRVPNNVQMQGAGRCLVTFIPQQPGTYVIDVTFNGEQVHGCPIKVDILPRQVGQTVHANLTPTAVSTAVNAGGSTSLTSQLRREQRSPRTDASPVSPSLLQHARQRSTEGPTSPTLLRDSRQPWKSTWAPSSSRVSSSLSPNREWSASSVYDKIYGQTERTLSPSDPSRSRIFSETTTTETIIRHTPSPSATRARETRSSSPLRSPREPFEPRQPSPSQYERRYGSPRSPPVRSPSPIKEDARTRLIGSPYRRTPSPTYEGVKRIERIDPVREGASTSIERIVEIEKVPSTVGYTVAQYGEPGSVSKDRGTPTRYFEDTLGRHSATKSPEISETPAPLPAERPPHPEYHTVYERYERKTEVREDADSHKKKPAVFRAPSPPPDYEKTKPSTTTTQVSEAHITLTPELPASSRHDYENVDKKPEVPKRAATPEGYIESTPDRSVSSAGPHFHKIQNEGFLRTQSEMIKGEPIPQVPIHRTEEKESIYDMPPTVDIPTTASEELRREAEVSRVKAEDDKILGKLGFVRHPINDRSIEIEEPLGDIPDNVIEMAGSKEHVDGLGVETTMHTLEPAAELPHSPVPSQPVTPATTPRTSAKFKKEKEPKKFDFGKSKFSSKHEVLKRGKEAEVKLDNLKLSKEDVLRVVVMVPIRGQTSDQPQEVETKVKKSGSKYEITFKPTEVGTHKVFAYVNDVVHPQAPFAIRVYDSSQIVVGDIPPQSRLNDIVEFTVDAGRAGFGNLEMAIKDSDGVIIPSHVAQLETESAKFLVTFTPSTKGMHSVNITFNKEVLKNSPFEVLITEPAPVEMETKASPSLSKKELKQQKEEKKKEEKERAKREKEEKVATLKAQKKTKHKHITKTAVTKIPSLSRVGVMSAVLVEVAGGDQLLVTVTDNKKNEIGTEITEIEPGVMQIEFMPSQVGDHEIEVRYGGVPVTGSPFTCRAYDPAMIKVGTIPKGLLDKPVIFTVDASEAGVGNLEVAVNDGRVPSSAHPLGNHKYNISFTPKESIDHVVSVRFNNEPVPGSPFTCQLVSSSHAHASGPGLERIPVEEEAQFTIESSDDTLPVVRVRDNQANDLPVEISREGSVVVARFVPKCVGNHQIDVSVLGESIAGSPFTAKAFDARQAKLTPCEKAVVGRPTHFTIDAARAGAGNMEIIVSVDNRNVPNFVQAEGQAKFKVSFTPQEPKEHIVSVKFNGKSVPGSPMSCQVSAAPIATMAPVVSAGLTSSAPERSDRVPKTALGQELSNALVGQKKGFTIENPSGKHADCNVVIIAPDGEALPVTVEKEEERFLISFTPSVKGPHDVSVALDGEPIEEEPYLMVVKSTPMVLPTLCLVGKKYRFDIDANDKEEVRVDVREPSGRALPVQLEELADGGVGASCRFKQVGTHTIDVYVQEQTVGNTLYQKVVDPLNVVQLVSEIEKEIVGRPTEHKILIDSGLDGEIDAEIEDPDRHIIETTLRKVSDTLWMAQWTPKVEGPHELSILVSGVHIAGSPFTVPVLDPSAVRVIGLRNERVGSEISFNVDFSSSGAREATVEITNGAKVVPANVKLVKPGLLLSSFTPTIPGTHLVDIRIDGLLLPECPYECFITDSGAVRASGDALKRAQRGRTARFEVSLNDSTRGELDVLVSDPAGGPLPVRCYKQHDDSYWVEFTPEHTGTHTIEVTFGDVPVPGSPYKCEVVDPRRVELADVPSSLVLRHAVTIKADRREAGAGDLQLEITDPNGAPVKVAMLKSPGGQDSFTFLPNKTGAHKLNMRMNGFQLPGFPQTLVVNEQEQPTVYGAAIDQSIKINEPASLIFDPKKQNGGLKVSVTGPENEKVKYDVLRRPNGTSEVLFYPEAVGLHNIAIHFNNKPLKGSPFAVRVVDPAKVIVNDLDMDRDGSLLLRLGQSNAFDVDATAAGPGKLRAEVRDADGNLLGEGPVVDDLGYGKYRVGFRPPGHGKYQIYLYWNELPVESAFPVRARSSREEPVASTSHQAAMEEEIYQRDDESRYFDQAVRTPVHSREKSTSSQDEEISRVMVRGDGLHRAVLKEPNEFLIDGSDLSREGRVTATLFGHKADIPVRLQHLGHNVFKAQYTPLTGGTYELHVLWNGRHVNGSPFKVTADSSATPADLVTVDASSLKIGIIKEEIKTLIDTRRAGAGQLSTQCMGPVKPAYCELYNHRDGTYTLNIRPSEVGKHTLTIKYNDVHVRGSPFLIHVSSPPDPSKVRVYGPGIEHGILSLFKSNFVVETRGAGAGQLTVRVRGPKGAFHVEMQREKKNERTIHCTYDPKEPGDYQVEVKWHGEHVPGSPFFVMIVDTEEELSRFLRGEAPSPSPATPFIPPGWVGPPPPPVFHHPMGARGGYLPPPPVALPPGAPIVPYGAPMPKYKNKYH